MLCTLCSIDKPDEEFATYWHSSQQKWRTRKQCKSCCYARNREWKRNMRLKSKETNGMEYLTRFPYLLSIYNCNDYREIPNRYVNDTQKELVHIIMGKILDWNYNEDTGIWSKEGVKDKNNKWEIFKSNTKVKKPRKPRRVFSDEQKKEILIEVKELKKLNWSYYKIGNKLGINDNVIFKWLKEDERKNNEANSGR